MNIIGMGKNDSEYICSVNHTELEKFLGQYYGKMKHLKPGDTVDLGKAYDFASDIGDAMKKTSEMIKSNKKIIEAIFNGIEVVSVKTELAEE